MTQFPTLLKTWRRTRRLSQLDLALEANVSARHISFLETGRARPSRAMVGQLGAALQMPLSSRNQMLVQAGFAPRYPARDWDDDDMSPIRTAIDHMLRNHAPYPAIALDRLWSIQQLNAPAAVLFATMGATKGTSLLDLVMGDALPQLVENWPEVAAHTALRLRTESAAQGGVPELDAAADHLARVSPPEAANTRPVVPTIYRAGPLRLSLFSTLAQFGTPEDLTLEDLRIELFFPADSDTEKTLRQMAQ